MRKIVFAFCVIYSTIANSQESTLNRPDIPGELMIDIGLNYWNETPEDLNQRGWPSKSVGLYYSKRKIFGSKLSFNYGLGLGLEKIDLGENNTLFSQNDDVSIDDFPFDISESPISKNRLAITYIDIPIDFRFHPKGTEDGEGLFIGVGAIVGLRLSSHMKWKYPEDGEDVVLKTRGAYDLNPFRYGFQIRAGFKGTHFFFKQYLSEMFNSGIDDTNVNPQMTTIGINFTGF
ncbi:outer membrane beta-barrel protein [Ekhidna sp.]